MYIMIVGAGKVGYYLAKKASSEGNEVVLIEKSEEQYDKLHDELGEMLYLGDGDEVQTLEELGTNRCDIFVSTTGEDEDNLVACQIAKSKFKVPRTIARVNNPKNEALFKKLGVDATINSTNIIYSLLAQEMTSSDIIPLAALQKGEIEIIEVNLNPASPVVGKPIKDITLPENCIIISIIKSDQEQAVIPKGETILAENDHLIALVNKNKVNELKMLLVGK